MSDHSNIDSTRIVIFAASAKSGGGKTVLIVLANRLHTLGFNDIKIYVGDTRLASQLSDDLPFAQIIEFGCHLPSFVRTAWSKLYFSVVPLSVPKQTIVVSINFWLPTRCKLVVYHVNLLNFHRTPVIKTGKWLRTLDAKLACRFADLNMFESNFLFEVATSAVRKKPKNGVVQYLGYNSIFNSVSSHSFESGKLILVSSNQPHKNNLVCMDALEILVSEHPEVRWVLHVFGGQSIGSWDEFCNIAEQRGLSNCIRVYGPQAPSIIAREMSEAAAVISSSTVESFCLVALEAMACGCPAIVTNKSSMPESVGDAGVVVPPHDGESLARATIKVQFDLNHRKEIVQKGYKHVANFSESRLTSSLIENLQSIL